MKKNGYFVVEVTKSLMDRVEARVRQMPPWKTFVGVHCSPSEPDAVDAMKVCLDDLFDATHFASLMSIAEANGRNCTRHDCWCMRKEDLEELRAAYKAYKHHD